MDGGYCFEGLGNEMHWEKWNWETCLPAGRLGNLFWIEASKGDFVQIRFSDNFPIPKFQNPLKKNSELIV